MSSVQSTKKHSTLERLMLTYFGLIAAASLLITVEFVWAVQTAMSETEVLARGFPLGDGPAQAILTVLVALRNKAFLMCVVQAVVTLVVLVMFIRRITGPLQEMVQQSKAISEGDLTRTIQVRRHDEIGLLGETINGLTCNIQEIVALGLSTDSTLQSQIEDLRTLMGNDPVCSDRLNCIGNTVAGHKGILEGFHLFPAPLGGAAEVNKE